MGGIDAVLVLAAGEPGPGVAKGVAAANGSSSSKYVGGDSRPRWSAISGTG